MNKIFIFLLLLCINVKLNAQIESSIKPDTTSLKQKTEAAELIFEGKVIADSSFWNFNQTKIYTLKYVAVLKEFKGVFNTDTIKIIVRERGSSVGEVTQEITDDNSFILNKDIEGIFFCKVVNIKNFYGVKSNNIYQINLIHSKCDGFIYINCSPPPRSFPNGPIFSHLADCCDGTFFDTSVEEQLYKPIESFTGQKRKVLRLDCLEAGKQGK